MKEVKLALLGYGVVGQGVKKILDERNDQLKDQYQINLSIGKVLVRNIDGKRQVPIDKDLLITDVEEILNDKSIDIVVEVMGGDTFDILKEALEKGKDVVTANKAVISKYFAPLHELAKANDCKLLYEASVGGGIPVIKPLYDIAKINKIHEVSGILNGTSNYILSHMTSGGHDYDEVLKEAQDLGYAESDPYDDVEGVDALRKIKILSSIAFKKDLSEDDIIRLGISKISSQDIDKLKDQGKIIKLICDAKLEDDKLSISVLPTAIDENDYYSVVSEALNSISVYGDMVGQARFFGPGAGMLPTGNAVVTDLIDVALGNDLYELDLSSDYQLVKDFTSRFYIRTEENIDDIIEEEIGNNAYISKEVKFSKIKELAENSTIVRIKGDER